MAGFLSSESTTRDGSLLNFTSFELLGAMTEILYTGFGESSRLSDLVRIVLAGMSEDAGEEHQSSHSWRGKKHVEQYDACAR